MANVCYNWMQAFGDAEAIKKFENEMYMDEYMYSLEIIFNYGTELTFSSETRWAPPEEWLENISKDFGIKIDCEYSEPGSDIAGKLNYKDGVKIMDLQFDYLEGRYHFMDWFEFIEMEVMHRLDDAEPFDDFIKQFDFCTEEEIKELEELFFEYANEN
jgi:Ferredoxin-like domain in Api92-like protein